METTITQPKVTKQKSIMMTLMKTEPDLFSVLKTGDLVEAAFIESGARGAFFSLRQFGTGIVYGRELMNAREIVKHLKPEEVVTAKVAEVDSETGYIELSLSEADRQKGWQELREMKEKGEVLTVTITGANSGGLMAEVKDVKAFLPVSQLSNQNYPRVSDSENEKEKILEELKKFIDKEIQVKIMTVNPKGGKLIISERAITDENVQALLKKYNLGDTVSGTISGVADFGAFMRFDEEAEIEGLIHISELDHRLVDDPREILSVGERVKAVITDMKDGRVSLSIKALKPDPWLGLDKVFSEGQKVKGEPFKYNPFGAFINVEGAEVQGLIHVSEFGSVEAMKKKLELGKKYDFTVEMIKPEEKRLILKLTS